MNSVDLHDRLWEPRAQDWADIQQHTIRPAALTALTELGPWRGRSLLDIGCGAGVVARIAHDLGATVTGLDACASLAFLARRLVPAATFQPGDMHHLPFADASFSAAVLFNSLQHSHDPARAVAEAVRVIAPGGTLTVGYWDPSPDSDALFYLMELGALLPPDPDFSGSGPGDLCDLLRAQGLEIQPARSIACPWHYPDLETALRGLLSTGPATLAIQHAGQAEVTQVIADMLDRYRRPDGSYLLSALCTYINATIL